MTYIMVSSTHRQRLNQHYGADPTQDAVEAQPVTDECINRYE